MRAETNQQALTAFPLGKAVGKSRWVNFNALCDRQYIAVYLALVGNIDIARFR